MKVKNWKNVMYMAAFVACIDWGLLLGEYLKTKHFSLFIFCASIVFTVWFCYTFYRFIKTSILETKQNGK